ncbi:MAG: hypothetical protein RLZZ352_2593 [Pseudomonadota bacterium]|jgi:hypothetical protein
MSAFRHNRRCLAALTLLVMLLAALLPTVAQAVVRASGQAQWVQVCSASGMFWVHAQSGEPRGTDDSAAPKSPADDASLSCPWCPLHGGAAGLPADTSCFKGLATVADLPHAPRLAAPVFGLWASAHARAPPASA